MTSRPLGGFVLLIALCLAGGGAEATRDEDPGEDPTPRAIGLEEQTGRRLAQLDVTVRGPRERLATLTRADFELLVRGEIVEDFFVDRVCRDPADAPTQPLVVRDQPTQPEIEIETTFLPTQTVPATYVFYFDQAFLTMEGRVQSMEIAKEMIPELIRGGNQAMVVSSGQVLTTYTDLTTDRQELLDAIKAIDKDPRQWDPTVLSEESKIQEVLDAMNPQRDNAASTTKALGIARRHQADERWRTERALQRLTMVLGRLAELNPPKAVVYFADRVRTRPGEHYVDLFSANQRENSATASAMEMDSSGAQGTFDQLTNEANSHGIRFYAIQAEGLQPISTFNAAGNSTGGRTSHLRAAQDSLVGLALETGGKAFLNGIKTAKIVDEIEQDLSCVYLVSFDPAGFEEDRGLAVRVRLRPKGLQVQARGQIVFQSEEARNTSRLMAAFAAPNVMQGDIEVRGTVIPTGFADGKYTALVQITVPGSSIPDASWDLGASLVSRGKVRKDTSRRVEVKSPGTQVVLETEMSFSPGPYELVLVAHETTSDQLVTGQLDGSWPDPDDAPATVGPIALVQPAHAAFVRGEDVKTQGALGFDSEGLVNPALPTALVTLICKSKGQKGPLVVKRRLVGDSSASFDDLELEFGDDRCAQIRDVIRSGQMTVGSFEYEVVILKQDEELASGSRVFSAGGLPGNPLAGNEVGS